MKVEEIVTKIGEDRIRQAIESDEDDALENLLGEEGISLTDEQLDYIAGGVALPVRRRPSKRQTLPHPSCVVNENIDTDDPSSPNWTGDDSGDIDITSTE